MKKSKQTTKITKLTASTLAFIVFTSSGALLLTSCGGDDDTERLVPASQHRKLLAEKTELEALNAVAQRRIELAEKDVARERAERERADRGRSLWQNSTAILCVLAGVMLFLGAAAGSATRKQIRSDEETA